MALSRRKKRSSRGARVLPGFVGTVALALVLGLTYLSISQKPAVYDEDTLCLVGEPPSSVLSVIIDGTDTIPELIAKKAISQINKAIGAASPNTLVSLYTISDRGADSMSPVVSLCKPRDGSDADALTECPGCMENRFKARFAQPMTEILQSLVSAEPANSSPILEALKGTVVDSFIEVDSSTEKQLLIVSDLLQHSDFYSFYRGVPDFQDFERALVSQGVGSMDMLKAEVHFLVVPRPRSADSFDQVAQFWRQFLISQNAGMGSTWEPL